MANDNGGSGGGSNAAVVAHIGDFCTHRRRRASSCSAVNFSAVAAEPKKSM
ncbi:MAG TPA: hypothetical protein VEW05_16630 [Candidatus Polarisedimenticolia bacterium]|nr:hypothetical protein [Candidatus Polarisedimenticolia bacterium]